MIPGDYGVNVDRLPDTACLVIEWVKLSEGKWNAKYYLRLPIRSGDIRQDCKNAKDGFLHLRLGGTAVIMSGIPIELWRDGQVEIPWRDGQHIRWDADQLNLPAYAVFDKTVTLLQEAK